MLIKVSVSDAFDYEKPETYSWDYINGGPNVKRIAKAIRDELLRFPEPDEIGGLRQSLRIIAENTFLDIPEGE